jgi:polyadenylate-binding protein
LFASYGNITSVKVMRDERGNSKGFGFVCFASPEDATKAVSEMHLKLVNNKPLYVGMHEKREQRIERLQSRYQVAGGLQMPGQMAGMRQMGQVPQGYAGQMYGQQSMLFNQPGMVNRTPQAMMGGMQNRVGQGMFAGYPAQNQLGRFPGQVPPTVMNPANVAYNPMMAANRAMAPRPRAPGMMGMQPQQMNGQMTARPMQQQMPQAMNMGQYQFNAQARNAQGAMIGQPGMMAALPQQRDPVYDISAGAPLTAAALAAAPPGLQKQMLGEKLYPSIQRIQPELAGKITGMMLEMDNSELLILLESEQQLRAKVAEAMRVLESRQ